MMDENSQSKPSKLKLAVWKFASCDGCQLSLLDCEDQLLLLADEIEIAHFPEASSRSVSGPYDLSLVEGSITTAHDAQRIKQIRDQSRLLVTIGACATAGGIQALRNIAEVKDFVDIVYAHPEYIDTLSTSTAIAAHVSVDFELRGCPIDKQQLVTLVASIRNGNAPGRTTSSVCQECKRSSNTCLMINQGTACLGPVTQAGCGAICPRFGRGCYGCFGPMDTPQPDAMIAQLKRLGVNTRDIQRVFQTFNAGAAAFSNTVPALGQVVRLEST